MHEKNPLQEYSPYEWGVSELVSPRMILSLAAVKNSRQLASRKVAAHIYGSFIGLKRVPAFVEPNSMPGNTTFVACFTRCELEYRVTGAYNGVITHL